MENRMCGKFGKKNNYKIGFIVYNTSRRRRRHHHYYRYCYFSHTHTHKMSLFVFFYNILYICIYIPKELYIYLNIKQTGF